MANRLTQEAPSRFQTICFQFPRLHGFRNLIFCRLYQMEQLLLAEAKHGLLFDLSQIVVINSLLSGLTEVFFARTMHSTSIIR